eukprot:g3393.t1
MNYRECYLPWDKIEDWLNAKKEEIWPENPMDYIKMKFGASSQAELDNHVERLRDILNTQVGTDKKTMKRNKKMLDLAVENLRSSHQRKTMLNPNNSTDSNVRTHHKMTLVEEKDDLIIDDLKNQSIFSSSQKGDDADELGDTVVHRLDHDHDIPADIVEDITDHDGGGGTGTSKPLEFPKRFLSQHDAEELNHLSSVLHPYENWVQLSHHRRFEEARNGRHKDIFSDGDASLSEYMHNKRQREWDRKRVKDNSIRCERELQSRRAHSSAKGFWSGLDKETNKITGKIHLWNIHDEDDEESTSIANAAMHHALRKRTDQRSMKSSLLNRAMKDKIFA